MLLQARHAEYVEKRLEELQQEEEELRRAAEVKVRPRMSAVAGISKFTGCIEGLKGDVLMYGPGYFNIASSLLIPGCLPAKIGVSRVKFMSRDSLPRVDLTWYTGASLLHLCAARKSAGSGWLQATSLHISGL
jgi:hypothetical protein